MELTLSTVPRRQTNLLIRCDLIIDREKTWLKFVKRTYTSYEDLPYHYETLICQAHHVQSHAVQGQAEALD